MNEHESTQENTPVDTPETREPLVQLQAKHFSGGLLWGDD